MKIITLSALSLFTTLSWAQTTLLYNSGATVKIEAGAVLYVEGGVHNLMGGTIDNDGTLEIQGNFLNQANWEGSQPNTLKFSGTGTSDLTPGSAVFQDVVIQKAAGNNVNLLGTMTVNDSMIFNAPGSAKIVTNDFDVKLGPTAKVAGYDADEYVATTGTIGMMEKAVTVGGTFEFPIGDLTNYSPITSVHSGTYAAANIRTRVNDLVNPNGHPNKPSDASEYISRFWDVNATGISSYLNTLTGTYVPADINGTPTAIAVIKGANYDGVEWSYAGSAAGANTVTGTTDDVSTDFTGTNFFGKLDLKVFLQGAYSAGSMTTLLPTLGQPLFPLNSPYGDAPATASSIPAGVTDWIKLELRNVGTPATITGKGSAFVKSDGSIVGIDGTSFARIKNGEPSAIVAVFHRNHLPIRTSIGLNTITPSLHNFTTSLAQAYDNPGITTNESMIDLGSGVFGLFRANVNMDLSINVLDAGLTKTNSNPTQNNVYSPYDVNMDKNVNVLDSGLAKTASNPTKSAHQ